MGGFAFDTSRVPEFFDLPKKRARLTLTNDGVQFLAKQAPDLLPDIPENDIKDKSKENWFAKSVFIAQVSWFCLQCISRLAKSLPVTVLELNTFSHVFYAILVSVIWWSKPLDVDEPTLIDALNPIAAQICAALYLRSKVGEELCCRLLSARRRPPTVDSASIDTDPSNLPRCTDGEPRQKYQDEVASQAEIRLYDLAKQCSLDPTGWNESISWPGRLGYVDIRSRNGDAKFQSLQQFIPDIISEDLEIITAFISMHLLYGGLHLLAWNGPFHTQAELIAWRVAAVTITSPSTMPLLFIVYAPTAVIALIFYNFALAIFRLVRRAVPKGVYQEKTKVHQMDNIHVTTVERAETAKATGPLTELSTEADAPSTENQHPNDNAWGFKFNLSGDNLHFRWEKKPSKIYFGYCGEVFQDWELVFAIPFVLVLLGFITLMKVVSVAFLILYILSRCFVVAECFISLAFAPPAVFEVPIWTSYVPHLG